MAERAGPATDRLPRNHRPLERLEGALQLLRRPSRQHLLQGLLRERQSETESASRRAGRPRQRRFHALGDPRRRSIEYLHVRPREDHANEARVQLVRIRRAGLQQFEVGQVRVAGVEHVAHVGFGPRAPGDSSSFDPDAERAEIGLVALELTAGGFECRRADPLTRGPAGGPAFPAPSAARRPAGPHRAAVAVTRLGSWAVARDVLEYLLPGYGDPVLNEECDEVEPTRRFARDHGRSFDTYRLNTCRQRPARNAVFGARGATFGTFGPVLEPGSPLAGPRGHEGGVGRLRECPANPRPEASV
jgi:hypothetical protein